MYTHETTLISHKSKASSYTITVSIYPELGHIRQPRSHDISTIESTTCDVLSPEFMHLLFTSVRLLSIVSSQSSFTSMDFAACSGIESDENAFSMFKQHKLNAILNITVDFITNSYKKVNILTARLQFLVDAIAHRRGDFNSY